MIHSEGSHFKDEHGRTLILRGVNLGGSSKLPLEPNGATHKREGFFEHRTISFVGRPFPLEEADEHFARLREWGLTCLRFQVTWEAIEHAGPGSYDQAYLDYVYAIIKRADAYGMQVLIDPHQDVWSRFTGGDGAPGWTFEAIGMDITKFQEAGAALVHQLHGSPFPRMIWPTNGAKLAAATMFTLFFGGNDFAPALHVEGEAVQDYLQRHYTGAIKQVALRVHELPNVIGYGTMNEPLSGFIGCTDASTYKGILKSGACPSVFQSMLLGAGYSQAVEIWEQRVTGPKLTGRRVVNPKRVRAWCDGVDCVWRQHGVWDVAADGTPRLLRPNYFSMVNGRQVDFSQDYYRPFANRFARAMRSVDADALIFLETEFGYTPPCWRPGDVAEIVYAPHWYDGFVLYLKRYSSFLGYDTLAGKLVIGPGRIRTSYAKQLAAYKQQASQFLRDAPVLIGEFGIPFDLQHKRAYRSGNFSKQIKAMDRSLRALEDALLSGTLWNYNADNTNVHGDQWNGEDFSIFSRDQQTDPQDIHAGGRALPAVVRPYARAVAGEPLRMAFDPDHKVFTFAFRHEATVTAPTELFVPNYQYPRGYVVEVSDGSVESDREQQVLRYYHTTTCDIHTIRLTGEGKTREGERKSLWSGLRTILRDRGKKLRTLVDSRGRRALSQAMWLVMRAGSLVLFRRKLIPHAEGLEHLPRSGPVLIAARHFHWFYDGYVLVRIVPRRLHIMVALDWLQSRTLRFLIELACSLPDWPIVLRGEEFRGHKEDEPWVYTRVEARRYLRQVIRTGNRLLRSGAILVMFPEGYASIDPHPTPKQGLDTFLPFQRGFIKLAELAERDGKTRVAIIPAGFTYTREGDKPWRATVRFGDALFRRDFASSEQLLQAVEEQVQALSYTVAPSLSSQAAEEASSIVTQMEE